MDTEKEDLENLFAQWKDWNRGKYLPLKGHACQEKLCTMREVPLVTHRDDMTPCINGCACTRAHVSYTGGGALFYCQETFVAHFCGRFCTSTDLNEDSYSICVLTGRQARAPKVSEVWGDGVYAAWRAARRSAAESTLADGASTGAGDAAQRTAERAYMWGTPSHRKKELRAEMEYLVRALMKPKRIPENAADQLETRLRAHVTAQRTRSRPPDVMEMWRMCLAARNRIRQRKEMTLEDEHVDALAPKYAKTIITLWAIVRCFTPSGRSILTMHKVKAFTEAAFGMIRDGIFITPTMRPAFGALTTDVASQTGRLLDSGARGGGLLLGLPPVDLSLKYSSRALAIRAVEAHAPRPGAPHHHHLAPRRVYVPPEEADSPLEVVVCPADPLLRHFDIPVQSVLCKKIINALTAGISSGEHPLDMYSLDDWGYDKLPSEAF